jgi:integrase/recombinase XerD
MSSLKLSEALTLFLQEHQNPNTQHAYKGVLKRLLSETLDPDREIDTVAAVELIQHIHKLRQGHLAEATIQKHIKTIKTFFIWLNRVGLLTQNPAQMLRQKRVSRYIEKDKAMTDEELEIVLSVLRYKPRQYALALFLADTGCRAGGAAGLKVQDLDLENSRAWVTEKGNKKRPVVFGPETARALAAWLLQRQADHPYVFGTKEGKVTPTTISRIIRRACLKAGIRSRGSHSLRHRKGHQMADSGIPVTVAATALGHSDPAITMNFYYPADFERAEAALRKLAEQPSPTSQNITKMQAYRKTK